MSPLPLTFENRRYWLPLEAPEGAVTYGAHGGTRRCGHRRARVVASGEGVKLVMDEVRLVRPQVNLSFRTVDSGANAGTLGAQRAAYAHFGQWKQHTCPSECERILSRQIKIGSLCQRANNQQHDRQSPVELTTFWRLPNRLVVPTKQD